MQSKEMFKEIVKLDEFFPAPYYIQYVIWCWRRPIYVGLPLAVLFPLFLVIDVIVIVLYGFTHWGK